MFGIVSICVRTEAEPTGLDANRRRSGFEGLM